MVYLCKIYRQKRTVMKKFGMVIAIGREVKGVLEAFGKVEKIEISRTTRTLSAAKTP